MWPRFPETTALLEAATSTFLQRPRSPEREQSDPRARPRGRVRPSAREIALEALQGEPEADFFALPAGSPGARKQPVRRRTEGESDRRFHSAALAGGSAIVSTLVRSSLREA